MAVPESDPDAHTEALAFGWFTTIVEAVERNDKQVALYLRNLPDKFKGRVMSKTKDYSGLALTAMQRATLSGNVTAVKALKAADRQLVGVQLPVSLRGIDPGSWRSELPFDCPGIMSDVLRLCPELGWLHLAVLSGHEATVRLVHGLTGSSERPDVITPALLSMFAHPLIASKPDEEELGSEAVCIPDIVIGANCTPEFVRDVWCLGVALAAPNHLLELVWHLVNMIAKRTPSRPFQMHTHLSLLPAVLRSVSFKGLVVGKPRMPLIEVIRVVEKIAADPKFCSPTWRTDLAYKEEAGLAPMFRSMLRSNHFHELRAFVSMDYTEGGTIPELPRIKTGRYEGYSIILFAAALGRTQMVDILAQNKQGSLGDVAPDGSTIAHLILANWRSSPIVMMEPHRVEGPKMELLQKAAKLWEADMKMLMQLHADVDHADALFRLLTTQNQRGQTPLHLAARHAADSRLAALLGPFKPQTPEAEIKDTSRLASLLGARDNEGQTVLMHFFASHSLDDDVFVLLLNTKAPSVLGHLEVAITAITCNLAPIPNSLLLHLLGQRDPLGRTCLWLLFSTPDPSTACDKLLAVGKMRWLSQRLTTKAELARLGQLCTLHQEPLQLQPEQQAANTKLLEELREPLIHAWPLQNVAGSLLDATWLKTCRSWGLDLAARDLQGRNMLYKACMGQNEDLVRALLADKEMLHVPDNTGLLPLGLAVARGYHKTARVILGHDTVQPLSSQEKMAFLDDGKRRASIGHAPLHSAVIDKHLDILSLLQEHDISLAEAPLEYMQVEEGTGSVLKHSQRTAQAWFECSLLQCAASVGHKQILAALLPAPMWRQGKVPWSHKQALQAGITAAVDLPGLLGEDIAVAPTPPKGASIPAWRGHPAWQQAAALVRQLGLAGQLEIRPEHLDCVRLLLLHRAGLQLSQLLRVQAACAALAQRKVRHPLSRLLDKRTLYPCGACSLYGLWRVCSTCCRQHYCSPACQRAHRSWHQSDCSLKGELCRVLPWRVAAQPNGRLGFGLLLTRSTTHSSQWPSCCPEIYSKEMPLSLYLWARKMQAAERGYCMRPDSGLGGLVQYVPPIGW